MSIQLVNENTEEFDIPLQWALRVCQSEAIHTKSFHGYKLGSKCYQKYVNRVLNNRLDRLQYSHCWLWIAALAHSADCRINAISLKPSLRICTPILDYHDTNPHDNHIAVTSCLIQMCPVISRHASLSVILCIQMWYSIGMLLVRNSQSIIACHLRHGVRQNLNWDILHSIYFSSWNNCQFYSVVVIANEFLTFKGYLESVIE